MTLTPCAINGECQMIPRLAHFYITLNACLPVISFLRRRRTLLANIEISIIIQDCQGAVLVHDILVELIVQETEIHKPFPVLIHLLLMIQREHPAI